MNSFHLVGQLIPNVAEDIKLFEDAVQVPAVEDAKSEVKSSSNFTSNMVHVASNLGIVVSEDVPQDSQATVSVDMRSQASISKELAAEAAATFQADLLSQDSQETVSIDMRSHASNSKELAAEAAEAAATAAFQVDFLEAEQEINPDEHFNSLRIS